eukprot:Amastigsp_a848788_16.p2 type:complete len:210 gc:universal Amastigsp_a848788_16:121-750(+)
MQVDELEASRAASSAHEALKLAISLFPQQPAVILEFGEMLADATTWKLVTTLRRVQEKRESSAATAREQLIEQLDDEKSALRSSFQRKGAAAADDESKAEVARELALALQGHNQRAQAELAAFDRETQGSLDELLDTQQRLLVKAHVLGVEVSRSDAAVLRQRQVADAILVHGARARGPLGWVFEAEYLRGLDLYARSLGAGGALPPGS